MSCGGRSWSGIVTVFDLFRHVRRRDTKHNPPLALDTILSAGHLIAVRRVNDGDTYVVEHEQIVLTRLHQLRRQRSRVRPTTSPGSEAVFPGSVANATSTLLCWPAGIKPFATLCTVQCVATGVEDEVVRSIWRFGA